MRFGDKVKYWWYLKGGEGLVKLAVAVVTLAILGLLIFATSGCAVKASAEPGVVGGQPPKSAEQPPEPAVPDIEIVAINEDKVYAIYISDKFWTGTYQHYRTTTPLIKELAKLGEKYDIKSIEGFSSRWVEADPTRGFIVFVEKKK